MAKQEVSLETIIKEIKAKQYHPIYYLMGEEPYYIDNIADYLLDNVLTESEKDFNLTILYGMDTTMADVLTAAKRFPMMSEYQVVMVKEAQHLKDPEDLLSYYLQKPLNSTILVFCHKHGTIDRRKKVAQMIDKLGVLYESKKLKDAQIPSFISSYLRKKNVDIEPKAAEMMTEFVGADLSRLRGELDKLVITLPQGITRITPAQVEQNIGISKDYNTFELKNALIEKNILKANKIVKYFGANPKKNPIQATLALLNNFFSNLMIAYYAPEKSERGVAEQLGLKTTWQSKDYLTAMRNYSGVKVMNIISDIRTCDAMSKGVGNSSMSDGELLKELVYKILH
jgi:DNA polymerase-3 subunit delta